MLLVGLFVAAWRRGKTPDWVRRVRGHIDDHTEVRTQRIDLIARTLWSETRGAPKHTDQELAGIAQVALNRVSDGRSLREVLTPPGRSDCCGAWNTSERFAEWWTTANGKPGFARCQEIARGVLDGTLENQIGTRNMFFHPGGLIRCEPATFEASDNPRHICMHFPGMGYRRAPKWATHDPKRIGYAIFVYSRAQ